MHVQDIRCLKEVHLMLQTVKLVSELIGKESATLLTADTALSELFKHLKSMEKSPLAQQLGEEIQCMQT